MEKPYRTDQAICSTRGGSNGPDNEPTTKAFHGIPIAAKAYRVASGLGNRSCTPTSSRTSDPTSAITRPRCTEAEYEDPLTDPHGNLLCAERQWRMSHRDCENKAGPVCRW